MKNYFQIKRISKALFTVALAIGTASAMAQPANFPTKMVRLVVPFAAGGSSDMMARQMAELLGKMWQQPVVVENRTGASGNIAADYVVHAEPDGHTVVLATTALVQSPSLLGKLNFDPMKDLAPVSEVGSVALVFLVNTSVPAESLKDFVKLAQAKPNQMAYGSFGTGSAGHLYMELFNDAGKMGMTHVPYKGEAPEFTDLMGGQIPGAIVSVTGAKPYVDSGKLRALAVTGPTRSPLLPNVPTFSEAGFAGVGLERLGWYGLLLPVKTPRAIVEKFSNDLRVVLANPEFKKRMQDRGITLTGSKPDEFAATMRADYTHWANVIREKKIKAD